MSVNENFHCPTRGIRGHVGNTTSVQYITFAHSARPTKAETFEVIGSTNPADAALPLHRRTQDLHGQGLIHETHDHGQEIMQRPTRVERMLRHPVGKMRQAQVAACLPLSWVIHPQPTSQEKAAHHVQQEAQTQCSARSARIQIKALAQQYCPTGHDSTFSTV